MMISGRVQNGSTDKVSCFKLECPGSNLCNSHTIIYIRIQIDIKMQVNFYMGLCNVKKKKES